MRLYSRLIIAAIFPILVNPAQAACTVESAQKSMIDVSNRMQTYSQQRINSLEKQGSLSAEFDKKFSTFVEKLSALSSQFVEATENKTSLSLDDAIDQSICDGYQSLLDEPVLESVQKEGVAPQQISNDPNCNNTALWERYGVLIQEHGQLTQAGKFSNSELTEAAYLIREISQASTTDIAKACSLLDEFESTLESKR